MLPLDDGMPVPDPPWVLVWFIVGLVVLLLAAAAALAVYAVRTSARNRRLSRR